MSRAIRLVLALLLLAWGQAGFAHTRSESHTLWTVDRSAVHMTFTVAALEAKRIDPAGRVPDGAHFLAYVTPRVGVTAAGKPCATMQKPRMLSSAPGFLRAEFLFACASNEAIRLRSTAFIDLVPTHTDFAQIETGGGDFTEALLTADQPETAASDAAGAMAGAGILAFVRMGIMHIFTGIDHMSFLVGLVLISRSLRDLVFVVTGFTIGHSLTLALAVTGIIRPHAEYIDALVALTIALIGVENVAVQSKRPTTLAIGTGLALLAMTGLRLAGIGTLPPLLLFGAALFSANYLMVSGHLRDAGRIRLVVTLVFGLIHGFGFAADMLETRLPKAQLVELLLGFNLGVEIGQLTIVLMLSGIVALLARARLTPPRPITVDVTASALVGLGSYWFVNRSF
jgi:hypothetical protein